MHTQSIATYCRSPFVVTSPSFFKHTCFRVADGIKPIPATQEVYVRLITRGSAYEGTVQVYHNGMWGSICDDDWTNMDAQVVCRMLGYSPQVSFYDQTSNYSVILIQHSGMDFYLSYSSSFSASLQQPASIFHELVVIDEYSSPGRIQALLRYTPYSVECNHH